MDKFSIHGAALLLSTMNKEMLTENSNRDTSLVLNTPILRKYEDKLSKKENLIESCMLGKIPTSIVANSVTLTINSKDSAI